MAGLLNPRDEATIPAGEPVEEEGNVSPEEQAEYDEFVTNGMQLIYDKEALPTLLQAVAGDGNPVEGLANAMVTIVARLEDSARDSGREISGDVMYHGSVELLEQVADLAAQAGIHDFTEEELESALYAGMDLYRSKRDMDGTLPVEALREDMSELEQADMEGRIDEVLPGLSEYAERAPGPDDMEQAMEGRRG